MLQTIKNWFSPQHLPYFALCVSTIALSFTIVNVAMGIMNFVLSRRRLLKVREVRNSFQEDKSGKKHVLMVDLLSYGAAIFDLEVTLTVFVRPTAKNIADDTVGTMTIPFEPDGALANPLNAGKGAKFIAIRRPKDEIVKPGEFDFFHNIQERMKAARLNDIYIHITCSEGRVTLRKLRDRRTHWLIDGFLGRPRGIKPYWWRSMISTWRVNREMKRNRQLGEAAKNLKPPKPQNGSSTTPS